MSDFLTKAYGYVSSFQSVMGLINSTLAQDVVYIGDTEGNQLFTLARIMRAGVNLDSEIFEHPLETGNKIADFKIDKPTVIQLGMMVPTESYQNVYAQIRQAKTEGTELIVQTRADTFTNMIIQAMPHEESVEVGDCLAMTITFREVQWYTANIETLPAKEVAVSPKSAAKGGSAKPDADTIKQGQKRAMDASSGTQKKSESILHGWFG